MKKRIIWNPKDEDMIYIGSPDVELRVRPDRYIEYLGLENDEGAKKKAEMIGWFLISQYVTIFSDREGPEVIDWQKYPHLYIFMRDSGPGPGPIVEEVTAGGPYTREDLMARMEKYLEGHS